MFTELNLILSLIIVNYTHNVYNICIRYCPESKQAPAILLKHNIPIMVNPINDGKSNCSLHLVIETYGGNLEYTSEELKKCRPKYQKHVLSYGHHVIFVTDDYKQFLKNKYPFMLAIRDMFLLITYNIRRHRYYDTLNQSMEIFGIDKNYMTTTATLRLVQRDVWNSKQHAFLNNAHLFPLIKNKYGKPLKVGVTLFNELKLCRADNIHIRNIYKEFCKMYNYTLERQYSYASVATCRSTWRVSSDISYIIMDFAYSVLVVPKPRFSRSIHLNFLFAFQWQIWMYSLIALLAIRFALYVEGTNRVGNLEMFGLMFGQILNQPTHSNKSRVIYLFALIFMIYFSSMYSCGVLDALINPYYERNYKTLQTVLDDPDLALAHSYYGLFDIENKRILNQKRVITDNISVENTMVFTTYYKYGRVELNRSVWRNHRVFPQYFSVKPIFIRVRKNSGHEFEFNEYLMRLRDTGLLNIWTQWTMQLNGSEHMEMSINWKPDYSGGLQPLNEFHILGVLLFWGIGCTMACLVFCFEKIYTLYFSHVTDC